MNDQLDCATLSACVILEKEDNVSLSYCGDLCNWINKSCPNTICLGSYIKVVASMTDSEPSVYRDITQPIHKFSWFKLGALVAVGLS